MGRRGAPLTMAYVHRFKDRHGHVRHYYRRNGKRVPLPGLPGEHAFMDAYARAAEDSKAKVKIDAPAGTIRHLVDSYLASLDFRRLQPSTQATYRGIYTRFAEKHGHRPVAGLTREKAEHLLTEMEDRPGAAVSFLKRLKTLMVFAIARKYIKTDPTYRLKAYKGGEIHTWTEAEIATFEAFWPVGSRERLAFALHLFTGQRRSDVHRMMWADIVDGRIAVRQQKTGAELSIPVHHALQPILDAADHTHSPIVATEGGAFFVVAAYGNWINRTIRKAKLPDRCVVHGLRKAAARRLSEAGCTGPEIMSITGHKTLAEVDRYIRAASQERLSTSAMDKQAAKGRQTGK